MLSAVGAFPEPCFAYLTVLASLANRCLTPSPPSEQTAGIVPAMSSWPSYSFVCYSVPVSMRSGWLIHPYPTKLPFLPLSLIPVSHTLLATAVPFLLVCYPPSWLLHWPGQDSLETVYHLSFLCAFDSLSELSSQMSLLGLPPGGFLGSPSIPSFLAFFQVLDSF